MIRGASGTRSSNRNGRSHENWQQAEHNDASPQALQIPYTGVHIVPDQQTGYFGMVEMEPVPFSFYPRKQRILDELEKRIMVNLAGIVAEARYAGRMRWKYGSTDFHTAFGLAFVRHSEGSLDEVDAYLKYVWVRTHELLKKPVNWEAVRGLADALFESKRLTYDEAADVMDAAAKPLVREHGRERSEVERLQPVYNGGVATDLALLEYLTRRQLRSRWRRRE